MDFGYQGGSTTRDYISLTASSLNILKNMPYNLGLGVAANNKTIGVSFEFGHLVDSLAPSTKLVLIDSIMHYFGIEPTGINEYRPAYAEDIPFLVIRPNPSRGVMRIEYGIGQNPGENVSLCAYDVSGRLVKDFTLQTNAVGRQSSIVWDGTDIHRRKLSSGVYFVRLQTDSSCEINKVVYLR